MKMSIDSAVEKLKDQQADFNEQYIDFGGINDAFNTAYEVMRKYQKVEDIYYHQSGEALENSLRAVIEYGNVD